MVLMYVRFPLSLRNVEDLLFERGIDLWYGTVRMWWNRFGPMFAGDIRRQRIGRMRELGNLERREMGRWANNRAEDSHPPFLRRERAMLRFRRMKTLQKFASVHANIHNQLASPPFGSILNATSSITKPSSNAAQPHWPSGSRSPAERQTKARAASSRDEFAQDWQLTDVKACSSALH